MRLLALVMLLAATWCGQAGAAQSCLTSASGR